MYNVLRQLTITGNILFALWILWNGIDEGFKASPLQLTSFIALWSLLAVNSFLLYRQGKK